MLLCGVTAIKICGHISIQQINKRRTLMSLTSHLNELKKKHQHLSDAVEQAQRSPATDDLEIARMKKQKLHIKEEITRLSA
jgi:hypothetical protein